MSAYDLLIRRGEAILPGLGRTRCDIAVRDGIIAAILEPSHAAEATTVLDAAGLVIMPGAIDAHIHLGHGKDIARPRVPEDAAQESAAAAKGGVTTFISYLMASEPFEGFLPDVIAVTEAGSRVDFGFHPIISTEAQLAGVPAYAGEFGAPTFKIFMNNRGGEGAPARPARYRRRLPAATMRNGGSKWRHGLPTSRDDRARLGHARAGEGSRSRWKRRGSPLGNASRPPFVEADAVQRAAYVAKTAGCPLYVVHTSSAEALEAGLRQRAGGAAVYLETCPHYLTHDIGWDGGDRGKINPPLREAHDREALWDAVLSGSIDTVATDHVHRDASSKAGGIWAASPGCPGLETLLPVLLSEGHHKRGLSLERIVDLVAANPARLMGMAHRKGAIAVGLDADLSLIDLDRRWKLTKENIASSAGYSIYENWIFKGAIVHATVRGMLVLHNGKVMDEAIGHGRYIHRTIV